MLLVYGSPDEQRSCVSEHHITACSPLFCASILTHQRSHLAFSSLHPFGFITLNKLDKNMANQKRIALIGLSSKGKGYVTIAQLPNAT